MTQDYLPSVLIHPRGSLSMERALKQIRDLLYQVQCMDDPALQDRVNASVDDVESMLEKIK